MQNRRTLPGAEAEPVTISRRQLLAGVGAGLAGVALAADQAEAQPGPGTDVVFTHTTVVGADSVSRDVALAVSGDTIVAIGSTDAVLQRFPRAEHYDGRGKALFPGLINCHAHLNATIARGFNEDFGFPNTVRLARQPNSLLSDDEAVLMKTIGILEAIRTGTTTLVESASNIAPSAQALASSGLRLVLAEAIRDRDNGSGPLSPDLLARSQPPAWSARLRDEGLRRISDLHARWHGAAQGRVSVFPAVTLTEDGSPELLRAVRAFAERHDLGYTIHLNQSQAEIDFMLRYHGLRPAAYLAREEFLGPRLFAAHCRYVDAGEIALLGQSRTIVSHQAAMAANRGVIPPIPALREAGCPIACGTDNNTNDLFEVMRVALLTERIRRNDSVPGTVPQPEDILADATLGGSRAVRQHTGVLAVGRKADLLVVDTQRPHLVPAMRIVSAWIHNGQPSDIESVMVDGRFVMRDRRVLTLDEAAIVADAHRVSERVWAEVLGASPVTIPRLRPPA
jgi:5-methylthioadenosine/S-adenosylhomocysteine deaminase